MNLLIFLAVVFGILVLVRLADVAGLASRLSGEKDETEQDKDNRINGALLLTFLWAGLILMIYMVLRYKQFMLPVAASEHGVKVDNLMNINWIVLFAVFFLTQILLFTFAFKYRYNKNRRAYYFHDNNKLEAIWTIIPTIVLAALITTGLLEWNNITDPDKHKNGMQVQVYGKQFDWTARYAGKDNQLARSDFRMITDVNPLGIDASDKSGKDDIIAKELYLPVGVNIEMVINSRDVIHSAFLPHFRVQMNAVPGMTTRFHFKPTITTARMREITGNEKFEYVMLCNKICGVAHYNMKMKVVVVEPQEFKAWLKNEKPALEKPAVAPAADSTAKPVTALK